MKYKIRDGVVPVSICGVDLLVPSNEIWTEVNQIKVLSKIDKIMIKTLVEKHDPVLTKRIFSIFVKNKSEKEIENIIKDKIESLIAEGYICCISE